MAMVPHGSNRPALGTKVPLVSGPGGESAMAIDSLACRQLLPLGELEHFSLRCDASCLVVMLHRTRVPFQLIGDIDICFRDMDRLLLHVPRKRYSLVIDTRGGPSRNDPEFEAAMKRGRRKVLASFVRHAVLVATAAGRLQIKRFAKDDGVEMMVTDDVAAAFTYLGLRSHEL